jgi:hypothetical protein
MWIDGVPGRPGWDGWFAIESVHLPGGTRLQSGTTTVSKNTDSFSSPAIVRRLINGTKGPASIWAGTDNDVGIFQIDLTNALVTSFHSARDQMEVFVLSFTKATRVVL